MTASLQTLTTTTLLLLNVFVCFGVFSLWSFQWLSESEMMGLFLFIMIYLSNGEVWDNISWVNRRSLRFSNKWSTMFLMVKPETLNYGNYKTIKHKCHCLVLSCLCLITLVNCYHFYSNNAKIKLMIWWSFQVEMIIWHLWKVSRASQLSECSGQRSLSFLVLIMSCTL